MAGLEVFGVKTEPASTDHDNTYLACEHLNFRWDLNEVQQAEHMWREGLSVEDMAVAFKRPAKEVFILLLDRLEKDRIHTRHGGMFGNRRM
jgi:hypothetical protein